MADKKQYLYNQEGKIVGELDNNFPNVKNFETYVNQEADKLDAKILELENKFNNKLDSILPVHTILINYQDPTKNPFNPGIGQWYCIGKLEEGQAIVGGYYSATTNGSVIRHTHNQNPHYHHLAKGDWDAGESTPAETSYLSLGNDKGDGNAEYRLRSDGSNDNRKWFKSWDTTATNQMEGGDENKAYGLGIGIKFIWQRNS